jgi:hypothetical protein
MLTQRSSCRSIRWQSGWKKSECPGNLSRRDRHRENLAVAIYSGDQSVAIYRGDDWSGKCPLHSYGIIGLDHPTLFEKDLEIRASCRNKRHFDEGGRRGVAIEKVVSTPNSKLSKSLERSCKNSAEFHQP